MDKIIVKTSEIPADLKVEDLNLNLQGQEGNICKFYGIPAALLNVDKRFKTHTFNDVLRSATLELQVLRDGDKVQVLDPKSSFVDDEQFDEIQTMLSGRYESIEKADHGFESRLTIVLPKDYQESFMGDVFEKQLVVSRRPEGGLSYGLQVERLICTNGSMVSDKAVFQTIRKPAGNEGVMSELFGAIENVSVNEYLQGLFMNQGEFVPCSVADMSEMSAAVVRLTGEDLSPYPLDKIAEVYANQDIDINKLSRQNLAKLPSGFSYYEAFNVMTHAVKAAEDTLENKIEVAKFYKHSRMKALSSTGVVFQHAPTFSTEFKHELMGDVMS